MSELKVNKISPRSGTDVTLGDSGDTFTVPAGASIVNNGTATGFGATGAVNWDTTAKTANFNAVSKVGYFVDTTSGAITVTLPATPSAGDIVGLVDYAGTFDTNALVIDPNGEDIEGGTDNLQLDGEREGVVLLYVDSTQGWLAISGINEGTDALEPVPYSIDFLVIGGGGAGGGRYVAGGGGAGGHRTSTQSVTPGTVITVTVGDGGTGNNQAGATDSTSGSASSISGSGLTTISSAGGGFGKQDQTNPGIISGGSGGSGGGGSGNIGSTGGSGNTPSTAPSQGNNGGSGAGSPNFGAGGGGGAGAVGTTATTNVGGNGGAGTASSITGSSVTRAGGGGGVGYQTTPGSGGAGGGGAGNNSGNGVAGDVNTGGGGGGTDSRPGANAGGNGGKGVVILAMPLANFSNTTTGSPTESDDGTTKVLQFNGDGSYTA
jgi:hypothetical protein